MPDHADLKKAALAVRENAYAPYSNFPVGAALRTPEGEVFTGCNVENVAYPQGTCAEAGAIAAMVATGAREVAEIFVIADAPHPVTPCGGCRQKLAEFTRAEARIVMSTLEGRELVMTMAELLPGAFNTTHLERT